MNSEIAALEAKIEQIVVLVQALRAENVQLKGEVSGLQNDCSELRQRMSVARERLEGLIDKLPEDL